MDGYLVYFADEQDDNHYEKVFPDKRDALEYANTQQKKKNNEGRKVDFYVTRIDIVT